MMSTSLDGILLPQDNMEEYLHWKNHMTSIAVKKRKKIEVIYDPS